MKDTNKRQNINHKQCNCIYYHLLINCGSLWHYRLKRRGLIIYNFEIKLTANWTVLGLHLILGPQEVTQLIGSTADTNPSTQCPIYKTLILPPSFLHNLHTKLSYIRKGKYRPAPAAPVYVTLRLPPLDSEMGGTGELWSKTKFLILEN